MNRVFTLDTLDVKGKRVLIRVDYNILDHDGNVKSEKRVLESLPTVKALISKGAKQIIFMTHCGRPQGVDEHLRTDKVAAAVSKLIGKSVIKINDWGENGLPNSPLVFLENLRFHPGEKSKNADEKEAFGKQLSSLADIYVNEAFANSHRNHASMFVVPQYIPGAIGYGLQRELQIFEAAMNNAQKPFVSLIGGMKADKANAIQHLLTKADYVLIGGALSVLFHKLHGVSVGASVIDKEGVDLPLSLVHHKRIILPVDYVIADIISNNAKRKVVPYNKIEEGMMALDIGPETVRKYQDIMKDARTIIWNGPMGVFEIDAFASGTKKLAEFISTLPCIKIIGGGDSARAIEKYSLVDKMTLVSTGGGASLALFEGKELPALKALKESYQKFSA